MNTWTTRAFWVREPGAGELRHAHLPEHLAATSSLLRADYSAVSPGTERLVGLGQVPETCADRMACRHMEGGFSLPVKYGYSLVGEGLRGALEGRRVFVMHPHQELAVVEDHETVVLPDDLPGPRATLIPNQETALNAVWDAGLGDEERPVVFGAGIVGVLIAHVLHRQGFGSVVVEPDQERRETAAELPFVGETAAALDDEDRGEFTVAFHATGTPAGLQAALDSVGFEGRVVDLSWYGSRPVTLDLGSHYHFDRKRLLVSQVSHVAPSHRDSHGFEGRMRCVLELLHEDSLDRLLGEPVPFQDMPALMDGVYRGQVRAPVPLVVYR